MRPLFLRFLFFGVALTSLVLFTARAPAADRKGPKAMAEFEVAPGGDFILLPLIIKQREYRFLLSTSLTTTVIDKKLCDELQLAAVESSAGNRRGKPRYRLQSRLGTRDLDFPDGVETGDYTSMREELDLDIQGELGMDVLRGQIMQIDFDRGALRFLGSVPGGAGEALKMIQPGQEGIFPVVQLTVKGHKPERFYVSTGRAGNSLDLDNKFLASLRENDDYTVVAKEKGSSRSGTSSFQAVRLEAIQVGSFRHQGVIANCGEGSSIGLSYLSRYLVTFDFAHGKLYLKKGAHFDIPDAPLEMWQVGVERDEKSVTVTQVHPHGPASLLGLRPGDQLQLLNDWPSSRISNWQIRRLLGRTDLPLTAEVTRAGSLVKLKSEPEILEKTADTAPAKGD